jgi:hypothetical protein
MQFPNFALATLVLALAPAGAPLPEGEALLPMPDHPLVLDQGDGLSLGDVLTGFARATGQTLVMTDATLLGVYHRSSNVRTAQRVEVPAERLHELADHPALLVRTSLDLAPLDVRQLATSLRGLLTDTNIQALVPAGQHSLILQGTGQHVLHLTGMLRSVQRAAQEEAERRPPPAEEEPGNADAR